VIGASVNTVLKNNYLYIYIYIYIYTGVGTLIVATIYLQLIQNRKVGSGSRRIPLAAPVVLIVRMERSTA